MYPKMLYLAVLVLSVALSCKKADEAKEGGESTLSGSSVINAVSIQPDDPRTSDRLQAVVETQELTTGKVVYRWLRNGEEISGEVEDTLDGDNFYKGDRIEVEAIHYQDEVPGEVKRSEPVTVLNSPPALTSATIEPFPSYSKDDLEARIEAVDPDGDYLRFNYQWKREGEDLPGETGPTLSHESFKKGERISYQVTMSDGESAEVVFHSKAVTILNSPPNITSQSSGGVIEGLVYEYRVSAEDPDGDPLEFKLSSAPEGMTIDPSTGVVRWEVGENQKNESYEFKVIVADSEGTMAIQPVKLSISFE